MNYYFQFSHHFRAITAYNYVLNNLLKFSRNDWKDEFGLNLRDIKLNSGLFAYFENRFAQDKGLVEIFNKIFPSAVVKVFNPNDYSEDDVKDLIFNYLTMGISFPDHIYASWIYNGCKIEQVNNSYSLVSFCNNLRFNVDFR